MHRKDGSPCGPIPHRQATGMPWMLPLGVIWLVLKSACASPQHPQVLALSSRGHCGDRTQRCSGRHPARSGTVLHPAPARRLPSPHGSGHHLLQMAVTSTGPCHGLRGPTRLPRSTTSSPRLRGFDTGDAQRLAPSKPRWPAPTSVGADQLTAVLTALTAALH